MWDGFYGRMVRPKDLASWQVEQNEIHAESLNSDDANNHSLQEEEVEPHIPKKWNLN